MNRTLRIGIAVAATLLVCALIILLAGRSPLEAFAAFWEGAVRGNEADRLSGIANTLRRSVPLYLMGLSVLVSFRCAYWNIGAEGQFIVGAIAATALGVNLAHWPGVVLLPLMLFAGAAAGAAWSAIAGALKVKLGVQEIISTIMLNFVAIKLIAYVVRHPLSDGRMPQSPPIGPGAHMPGWATGPYSRLDFSLVLAILAGVLVWVFMERSALGFQVRAVGAAPVAARHAGLSTGRATMLAVSVSGALAGLAGAMAISSSASGVLTDSIAVGDGYRAIAVALLGGLGPIGTAGGALLFGALEAGAQPMEAFSRVPRAVTYIVQAMVIFFYVVYAARRSSKFKVQGSKSPANTADPVDETTLNLEL